MLPTIQISDYRLIQKGVLYASFNMTLQPLGLQIRDCKHFIGDKSAWFSFPAKEVKKQDGTREFFPLLSIPSPTRESFQAAVLHAIKSLPIEAHANSQTPANGPAKVQDQSFPF